MTEGTICGIELDLAGNPHKFQSVAGSKVYYVDHLGQKIELKDVVKFSVPESEVDSVLFVTVTLPLLNVTYQGES
jgi:hypothetical protein